MILASFVPDLVAKVCERVAVTRWNIKIEVKKYWHTNILLFPSFLPCLWHSETVRNGECCTIPLFGPRKEPESFSLHRDLQGCGIYDWTTDGAWGQTSVLVWYVPVCYVPVCFVPVWSDPIWSIPTSLLPRTSVGWKHPFLDHRVHFIPKGNGYVLKLLNS